MCCSTSPGIRHACTRGEASPTCCRLRGCWFLCTASSPAAAAALCPVAGQTVFAVFHGLCHLLHQGLLHGLHELHARAEGFLSALYAMTHAWIPLGLSDRTSTRMCTFSIISSMPVCGLCAGTADPCACTEVVCFSAAALLMAGRYGVEACLGCLQWSVQQLHVCLCKRLLLVLLFDHILLAVAQQGESFDLLRITIPDNTGRKLRTLLLCHGRQLTSAC